MKSPLKIVSALCVLAAFTLLGVGTYLRMVELHAPMDLTAALAVHLRLGVLLMFDIASALLVVIAVFAGREVARADDYYLEQARRVRDSMQRQIDALVTRNDELEDKKEDLEKSGGAIKQALETLRAEFAMAREQFEVEARRLAEQAYHALENQVEAHTKQLDAINLALQYQRADIKKIRGSLRGMPALPDEEHERTHVTEFIEPIAPVIEPTAEAAPPLAPEREEPRIATAVEEKDSGDDVGALAHVAVVEASIPISSEAEEVAKAEPAVEPIHDDKEPVLKLPTVMPPPFVSALMKEAAPAKDAEREAVVNVRTSGGSNGSSRADKERSARTGSRVDEPAA